MPLGTAFQTRDNTRSSHCGDRFLAGDVRDDSGVFVVETHVEGVCRSSYKALPLSCPPVSYSSAVNKALGSEQGTRISDDTILLVAMLDKPGLVITMYNKYLVKMSFKDAETYKDGFERLKLLPEHNDITIQRCSHRHTCSKAPKPRCKACRIAYCL